MNNTFHLLLGSNVHKECNIPKAIKRLRQIVNVEAYSQVYESHAIDCDDSVPDFYNIAIKISTPWDADTLKWLVLREIEAELGRVRNDDPNAPRPIDIDIILYNNALWEDADKELTFAHVVLPMAALEPELFAEHATEVDQSPIIRHFHLNEVAKTVMITGAAKRIGRSIALDLARQGYNIVLHYHKSQEEAETLQRAILSLEQNCTLVQADLCDEEAVQQLLATVFKQTPVDILINSAALFLPDSMQQLHWPTLKDQWQSNFFAPYALMHHFSQLAESGQIINITDGQTNSNHTQHMSYLLAKKSLANLTEMAALQLAPNFRVNAIAPGWILDPVEGGLDETGRKERLATIPLNKQGSVGDINQAITFLLESDYVTGQTVFVDGGRHSK